MATVRMQKREPKAGEPDWCMQTLAELPWDKVRVSYDREADVLYISLRYPQSATDTRQVNDDGVLLRYCGKELVGITLLDVSSR